MRIRLGVVLVNFFPRSFLIVECSVLCMFCLGRLACHRRLGEQVLKRLVHWGGPSSRITSLAST